MFGPIDINLTESFCECPVIPQVMFDTCNVTVFCIYCQKATVVPFNTIRYRVKVKGDYQTKHGTPTKIIKQENNVIFANFRKE